jgi:hypothetical protein
VQNEAESRGLFITSFSASITPILSFDRERSRLANGVRQKEIESLVARERRWVSLTPGEEGGRELCVHGIE